MEGDNSDKKWDDEQVRNEKTMDSKTTSAGGANGDDAAADEDDEVADNHDDDAEMADDHDEDEDNDDEDENEDEDNDSDNNDDDSGNNENDRDLDGYDGKDEDEQQGDSDDEGDDEEDDDEQDEDEQGDSDDENDESSSDESEEGNEQGGSDTQEALKKVVTEDGREISEYEMLRLERIRRNKAKLAALGLESQTGGGVLGEKPKPKKKKPRRPSAEVAGPKRSSLSRRSKKNITHYAAELPSVRQLLKGQTEAKKEESKKEPKPRKTKDPAERMDRVIHDEFRRIRAEKKSVLRQAEKDNRAAAKEVKYWKNQIEIARRREIREQKRQEQHVHRREEEKEVLGGKTARQMLQEVDKRMPELLEAAEEYDEKYEAEARLRERELQRFEMEERMKTIDALERYPKILKDASSLLSSVLVERAPKDPPPPRRSKRAGEDADEEKPDQPKKKKTKTKTNEEEPWSQKAPMSAVSLPQAEDAPSTPPKTASSASKKRRVRGVRNVGGWVSPDFAQRIDRAWLERDTPPTKFDLKTFVPQVGDAVLYYPTGHYDFLAEYPDVLGKKTRQITRVPLWERFGRNKERDDGEDASQSNTWCTEEWAQSVARGEGGGRYPILCTVQTVCAEFPPDPKTKVVKKKEGADGEEVKKVFFRGPKNGIKKESAKIRLAVTLRPLSPVVPGKDLTLPPTFSVVTFPSKKNPFLVPFAWAYSLNHSMAFGTTVFERNDPDSLYRISKVDVPEVIPNDGRIDSRQAGAFLGYLGDENNRKENLTKTLSEDSRQLPLSDALVALSTFESTAKKELPAESTSKSTDFVDIICQTLPVWEAVTVTSKDVYDRKKRNVHTLSPWELCVAQKGHPPPEPTPDRIAELPSDRDESLRMKIESVFDEVFKDHEPAALFAEPITEDVAPSYFCAVPVGMWMSRIQKRLRGTAKSKSCQYRSVAAILSDVSSIVENCLLYNSPESEIVEAAVEVTTALKDGISRVVREHNKELTALQKADEERRRHVMQLCGSGSQGPSRSSVTVCRIRKPFKHRLYRDWLQEFRIAGECKASAQNNQSCQSKHDWVPQAGDDILYSKSIHSEFVKGHHTALELDQCEVVSPETESGSDDWLAGRVVWTKAAFPRALTKKDIESPSFSTNSTLLALGILFNGVGDNENVHVVYWRPCMFHFEREDCREHCGTCGASLSTSFVCQSNPETATNGLYPKSILSHEESQGVERCLNLLKKRVLSGVAPSHVDSGLTKSKIKQGYETPPTRHGLHSLPSYENLLMPSPTSSSHSTRKGGTRFEAPPAALTRPGYVVHWKPDKPKGGKDAPPKLHETVSPWPNMCLELVRLRLKNQYYRARAAVENDLIECFSSVSLLMVAEPASQKKSPLSVKKLAKLLASQKGILEQDAKLDVPSGTEEEILQEWVETLKPVRELYSVALASVTDTERFERITGLHVKVIPSISARPTVEKEVQNSAQVEAREKLRALLDAVGKDPLAGDVHQRGTGSVPTTKLSVICDGEKTEYEKFMTTLKRAFASTEGKDLKVKITCQGKEVHVDREIPGKSSIDAVMNGSDVELKVIANGEEISVADTSKIGRSAEARDVVNNFISIGARELEGNDTLVKFLFARPRRSSVCARCSAHRKNMLHCRVRRTHANPDFDWLGFFQECNGIDGILETMKTGENRLKDSKPSSDHAADDLARSSKIPGSAEKMVPTRPTDGAAEAGAAIYQSKADASRDEPESSGPKEQLLDQRDIPGNTNGAKSVSANSKAELRTEERSRRASSGVYRTRRRQADEAREVPEQTTDLCSDGAATVSDKPLTGRGDASKQCANGSSEQDQLPGQKEALNVTGPGTEDRVIESGAGKSTRTSSHQENKASEEPKQWEPDFENEASGDAQKSREAENAETKTMGNVDAGNEPGVNTTAVDALKKAQAALELSVLVLEEARRFAKAPARLSEAFIRAAVPIDKGDGHYIYCIICGLSGNLVCCDGCANVVHSRCIGLEKVPEGEWFCEECNTKKPASDRGRNRNEETSEKAQAPVSVDDGDGEKTASSTSPGTKKRLPFDRLEFNQDRADRLTALVQELHDLRPDLAIRREKDKHRKKTSRKKGGEDDSEGSDMEGGSQLVNIDSSDPLFELTDTAKSFLCAIGINTYTAFLSSKTSELANKFARWRKRNSLVELRGSGTTAYVSTWKRTCREIAAERNMSVPENAGGVIYKEDSELEDSDSDADEGQSRKKRRKVPRSLKRRQSRSKVFDNPWDALSAQSQEFLNSIGIRDAESFLAMRTTDIAQKFVKWRKRMKLSVLKSNGETATVSAWRTQVRKAMETIDESGAKNGRAKSPTMKGQKRDGKSRAAPQSPTTSSLKKVDTASGRAERAQKRKSRNSADTPRSGKAMKTESDEDEESDGKPPFNSPLEALTPTAQQFLRDEGITCAKEFLSLRSGELGERFGAWRRKMGMTKLRGSGEGATISAWKSLCRKAVAAHERYKERRGTSDSIRVIEVEEASTPTPRRRRETGRQESTGDSVDESPPSTSEGARKKRSRGEGSPSNGEETPAASPIQDVSPETAERSTKRTRRRKA